MRFKCGAQVTGRAAKFAHDLANIARKIGQFFGSKDDQRDHEYDYEMCDAEHGSSCCDPWPKLPKTQRPCDLLRREARCQMVLFEPSKSYHLCTPEVARAASNVLVKYAIV